jgi:hypothetical protein
MFSGVLEMSERAVGMTRIFEGLDGDLLAPARPIVCISQRLPIKDKTQN